MRDTISSAVGNTLVMAAVFAAIPAFIWLRYESFDPCDMLRHDLIRAEENKISAEIAAVMYFDRARPFMDSNACLDRLWELHFGGN